MNNTIYYLALTSLALLLSGAVLIVWYRSRVRTKLIGKRILNSVFLEVLVPKETTVLDKEKEPVQQEKEIISVAEQLFATLSHTERRNFSTFMTGQEPISFEIVSVDKKISFYINCGKHIRDLVEKQVQAQYPAAEIDEVAPPQVFPEKAEIAAVELSLQRPYIFPIKTYKLMESDPLSALTTSLSKLGSNEAAVFQLVIAPAPLGWRRKVVSRARQVQKGKIADASTGVFQRGINRLMNRAPKQNNNYQPVHLTPMQQETVKRLEEKSSKSGFEVNLRLVVSSASQEEARSHIRNLLSSFMQYSQSPFNGFRVARRGSSRVIKDFIFRTLRARWYRKVILNTEELSSLFHLPTRFTQTPNIKWLSSKRAPAPLNLPQEGLLLGKNVYRGIETPIRIGRDDRRRHMYVVGRTGTGKSEFLKNLARRDIEAGEGVAVVDPHGDLVEDLLKFIPRNRVEDVILFEPFDLARPMGLNMLEVKTEEEKDFAVQEMIEIFYKLFPPEIIGPLFEHNMRNVMLTLMADREYPGTIAEIPRMFTDPEFQRYKLTKVKDAVVRSFWEQEMAKTSEFHKSEMLGYLISKVGRFVENEMMRNIIGQARSSFDFREVMDQGKILLINLSKGKTGEVNSKLLGLIIVSKLQMAALSRADLPEGGRRDFYLYIDEFQNFVTDSLATILSEARKYHLNLIMAHQYLNQLVHENNTKIRDAVFGNAGTIMSFRVGVEDAETLAKEFAPVFNQFDVINIDRFNCYIKLMVEGAAARPFNLETLPPPSGGSQEIADAVKKLSKLKYTCPRGEVEAEIMKRSRLGQLAPGATSSIERSL